MKGTLIMLKVTYSISHKFIERPSLGYRSQNKKMSRKWLSFACRIGKFQNFRDSPILNLTNTYSSHCCHKCFNEIHAWNVIIQPRYWITTCIDAQLLIKKLQVLKNHPQITGSPFNGVSRIKFWIYPKLACMFLT